MAKQIQKPKNTSTRSKNKGIALVKKSNQLIEARYNFSVWEMRFFLSVIAQIRREDEDFQPYRIWFRDIIKMFGLNKNHNSYELLREGANKLMDKSFYVRYEEKGSPREVRYHILRKIDYSALNKEEGRAESQEYIDVTIEQEMKPFLLQLQRNFTTYDLANVIKLGVYPIRIYELLKQYETFGKRTLDYDELKRMLELEHYSAFGTFYQRVISPAVEEINKNTDLHIHNVEKIKSGKKVVALTFFYRQKANNDAETPANFATESSVTEPQAPPQYPSQKMPTDNQFLDEPNEEKDHLFKILYPKVVENMGVTPLVFASLIKTYSEEQFNQAIRITNRAKIDGQIKSNVSGFFIQALKNGYTDLKEEQMKKQKRTDKEKAENAPPSPPKAMNIGALLQSEEHGLTMRNRIRELVAEDPDITPRAIEFLQKDKKSQLLITELKAVYGRELNIEDFRQIKELRDLVMEAIVLLNKPAFESLF